MKQVERAGSADKNHTFNFMNIQCMILLFINVLKTKKFINGPCKILSSLNWLFIDGEKFAVPEIWRDETYRIDFMNIHVRSSLLINRKGSLFTNRITYL